MAEGLRDGWADLFLVDQAANTKTSAQLTELMKKRIGKGRSCISKDGYYFQDPERPRGLVCPCQRA